MTVVPNLMTIGFTPNGVISTFARYYVFAAGTETPATVYSDADLTTAHSHPINADIGGVFPPVYAAAGSYKIRIKKSAADGGATLYEVDDYTILTSGSELSFPTAVKTDNFTVTADDRGKVFLCDASGIPGLVLIVTADSDTLGNGFPFFVINNAASGTITVQGTGSQTINGAATLSISTRYTPQGFVSVGAAGWNTLLAQTNGIPSGGSTGQILRKTSATDYDVAWGAAPFDQQTFNASGTWTKPTGSFNLALIEIWGGGGSGGRRVTTGNASGGGGASYNRRVVPFASLGATETVTVGAGGAAVTTLDAFGNDGANSTFGTWLTGYNGGGGEHDIAGADALGGGGGGHIAGAALSFGGGSPGGVAGTTGSANPPTDGGGAAGGGVTTGNVSSTGGNAFGGGGGGGGISSATTRAGGTSKLGGNGGASADGGNAVAGTQPGGGGGAARGGNSGKGGDGRVVVTCW